MCKQQKQKKKNKQLYLKGRFNVLMENALCLQISFFNKKYLNFLTKNEILSS